MKKTIRIAILVVALTTVFALLGCNESYAQQKKQEMEAQWEKSKAQANLPVAEGLIDRGELKQAKKMLNECLVTDPESPEAYFLIGRIYFIEGQNQKAQQFFRKSVELDPQMDKAWSFLGMLAVLEKDYQYALELHQKALELMPSNTDYIISVYELYIEMNQLSQAQKLIQNTLSKHPNSLELMLAMARLYQRTGENAKAAQIYEQAQLIQGDEPAVLESCGYVYMVLEQWERAAEKFESLLSHYEQDQEHYNITLRSLALCSFNGGNYGRALTCYDQLSLVYRDDPEIWYNMAESALGVEDTARAIRCAQKALQLRPSWAQGYAVLGSALYVKGDYERSLDAFAKITSDDEYAAFGWFMSGRCYQQLGQTVQANLAFDRAEQLDPNNELITTFLKRALPSL